MFRTLPGARVFQSPRLNYLMLANTLSSAEAPILRCFISYLVRNANSTPLKLRFTDVSLEYDSPNKQNIYEKVNLFFLEFVEQPHYCQLFANHVWSFKRKHGWS